MDKLQGLNLEELNFIQEPAQVRGLLFKTAINVVEGKVTVAQANAVIGLSCEAHKSLRQEWDMRTEYAAPIEIINGVVSALVECKSGDEDENI